MHRRAFTLVEVLVSLAIFALAAVVLSAAYTNVLLARQAMRQVDIEDEGFTRSRAALLETAGLEDAKTGGDIDLSDGRKAQWSTEIEPTQISDLFSVTLTVDTSEGIDGNVQPSRSETFYLLRPSWSVSSDRTQLTDAARERLRRLRSFEGTSTLDQAGGGGGSGGGRTQGGKGQSNGKRPEGPRGDRNGQQGGPSDPSPGRGSNNQGDTGGAPRTR